MKPKLLKIKGLNSFLDEQKIEFSKLTEKGLFGIFGPTGSGKSSILDAITLALYGEISRASKNDQGFINTNTNFTTVSIEFEIGEGDKRKTYIAERNITRDKHGSYKTKAARLLSLDGEISNVIAEKGTEVKKQVEDILGLSLDDFTRSVVLPQGKFSEFLKLTGLERRNMLERIFNLEKYGRELIDKVRRERNKNLTEETKLEGELKNFEGISEDAYEALAQEINILTLKEEELKNQKAEGEEKFNKYKELWNLQREVTKYKLALDALESKREEYEINKIALDKGEKANKIKDNIDNLNSTEEKLKINSDTLEKTAKDISSLEDSVKISKEDFVIKEEERNNKIPVIIKKQEELKVIIDIIKQMDKLKEDRKVPAKKWNDLRDLISLKEKTYAEIKFSLDQCKESLEKNEIVLNENKVDAEFRSRLQMAIDVEKEYEILVKEIKELNLDLEKRDKLIEDKHQELLHKEKDFEKKSKALNQENSKLDALRCPGDISIVNDMQKKIIEEKNKFSNLQEKVKEKKSLINELEENSLQKEIKLQGEKALLDKISILKEKYESTKVEINKILENNRASVLAKELQEGNPCPVCGSTHHVNLATEMDNALLQDKEEEFKNLEIEIEKHKNELNDEKINIAKTLTKEENLMQRLMGYKDIDENIDINALIEELGIKEEELNNLSKNIKLYEEDKNKLNLEILSLTTTLGQLGIVASSLKSLVETEKKNRFEREEVKLKKQQQLLLVEKEYINLKEELQLKDLKEEMKKIQLREKIAQEVEKKNKELREEKEEKDKILENLNKEINDCKIKRQEVETQGKAIKDQIEEKEKELKERYQGENPIADLEALNTKVIAISKAYEDAKIKYEKINNDLIEAAKYKEALLREKLTLENLRHEQMYKLNISLEENGFINKQEAVTFIMDIDVLQKMKTWIRTFEDELSITKSNIKSVQEKLKGEEISEEQYREVEKMLLEIITSLEENHDNLIKKSHSYKEMNVALEKCKELFEKKKKVSKKLELINQIDKAIQGNKFVEYVAKHQLKYIAKEASKQLRGISRDRYAIEIDEEGNFIIVDDFNGGERRSTTTLSGGETFLASLALALALSSQIQLKGSAPLEFFFLDEGFGTLDSELLDVVMSSLERLHHGKLSVGIISHVEELKQRIPIKLIVTPAKPGEGGSKVQIEY
ncbi:AAA family ATPase [Clostridium sp.]|uniref:AAA family ATPase n=1 Tax=Clostridium sp. TaxID=1506 RepID=UPI002FC59DAB